MNEDLIRRVRHYLNRRLIEFMVRKLGTAAVFAESQQLPGYVEACESWQKAYWTWVDTKAPVVLADALKESEIDWSRIDVTKVPRAPTSNSEQKLWWTEQLRQEALQRSALFELAMRGPEASDKETYRKFLAFDFQLADKIGVDWYLEFIAKQKQRKPSKDKGDRRLKPQLLLLWVPGCLWALTNEGIAQFLQSVYPRSQGALYTTRHISEACGGLGFVRRPHWREIRGDPPRCIPLR